MVTVKGTLNVLLYRKGHILSGKPMDQLQFSHSRSVSETSSSSSSKASISAKYALCFFTKSSGNLGVLGEGRFCSKLQAIRKVKIMDVVSNVFQIPERLKSRYPSRYFHIHTLCQCTFRPTTTT